MPHRPLCENCPFQGEPFKQAVGGEWWVDDVEWRGPDIMCVGQNPGAREDAEGSPFIGQSGTLLKSALRLAGIKRAYMTNAAMCAGEIDLGTAKICADHLEEEIEQVKPQWIFAFGNIPLQRLNAGNRGTITAMAGKEIWDARHEAWLLPGLHPAFILRDPGKEGAWMRDIMRFGRLIRGEIQPPPNVPPVEVRLVDSGAGLVGLSKLLETEPMIAYDFETNIQPWWSNAFRPYTIAFSFTGGEASVVPLAHPEVDPAWRRLIWKWLRGVMPQLLPNDGKQRLVHNGIFDDLVWYRLTGVMPKPTWDTMIGLQLLDEDQPKALKWAGRAYLGWPDWDIDARKHHALDDLYPYNGFDAAALPPLFEIQMEALRDDPWLAQYAETVEMPKLRALERMLARGIYVDRSAAAGLLRQAWRQQREADHLVPVRNPASSSQVAQWLYQDLQLPVLASGKTHPSTNEAIINRLALRYPEAKLILDCRRPRKKITTYFRPVDRATKTSFDGRYHPDYKTASVETGRLSSRFHTIPRDTSVRPMFSAPEGRVLISADYSQIEARLVAWLAAGMPEAWDGVPHNTLLWAFHQGDDIYRLFAAIALKKHPKLITRDERQNMGKVPVLAEMYGISWQGLQEQAWVKWQIDWPPAEARRLHDLFARTFPEIIAWHKFEEMKLRNRGWTRTPIGRWRHLPLATQGKADAIRSGINAVPQSLASDITQMSMILLDRMGARIVGNIHDALLVEAPLEKASAQGDIMRLVMEHDALEALAPLGLRLPPGLITVEISYGPWGLGKSDLTDPVVGATV